MIQIKLQLNDLKARVTRKRVRKVFFFFLFFLLVFNMSEIKAHLFPFSVDYEGPVKSKEYLSVEKGPNGQYETVILGRQLIGHSVSTSGITQGHVFKKDMFVDEQDQKESMPWKKTDTVINDYILWKKDTAPDKQDARIKAIESWLDISRAVEYTFFICCLVNINNCCIGS